MDVTFRVHPLTHSGIAQYLNGSPLEDTSPNSTENVLSRLSFQHDAIDTGTVQYLGQ